MAAVSRTENESCSHGNHRPATARG